MDRPGPLSRRELAIAVSLALLAAPLAFRGAAAGLAAYLLARRLGLGSSAAALAGVSCGGSALVLVGGGWGLGTPPGAVGVGLSLIAVALVSWWSRWSSSRARWLGVPLVVAALLLVAFQLGAPWLALAPDALGVPGRGRGYLGAGDFWARCAAWVPLPTLALALTAALSGRRPVLAAAAFVCFLLALGGWGIATLPSALLLALAAGSGLASTDRPARVAAVLTTAALLAWVARVDAELLDLQRVPGDPPDELVELTRRPRDTYTEARGVVQLAGRVHPSVLAADVRVRLEPGAVPRASQVAVVDGALRFAMDEIDVRDLTSGRRYLSIDLLNESGERLGTRDTATFVVRHPPRPAPVTWLVLLGVALAVPFRRTAWVVVALAALQVAELAWAL